MFESKKRAVFFHPKRFLTRPCMRYLYRVIFLVFCLANAVCAQARDSTLSRLSQLPDKYFSQVSSKSRRFEKQVSRRSEKALNKLARQERKMQARLAKIDSVAAKNIFTRSIDSLGHSFRSGCKEGGPESGLNEQTVIAEGRGADFVPDRSTGKDHRVKANNQKINFSICLDRYIVLLS
ncbi:hypothetical protein [Chitinophaga japonensis]|uniref:Uncharacterized protein n=1 Tax=Chitinophaga japonensis TaxID=104662 RepID=A0A562SXZ7_CHIJA|nr:hypothetical protein [Chitinophaga japonensis]TWI86227.1 hypothetical protein LX66_3479 [Chitinophaga japonensis]